MRHFHHTLIIPLTAWLVLLAGCDSANTDVKTEPSKSMTSKLPHLDPGIRSGFADNNNGLRMHFLEAGYEEPGRPCILLLHGFPELAYSWRKIMVPLAREGYHVIAPDQRGYGLTTGWDPDYDGDLASFRMANIVKDAMGLLEALEIESVRCVVGHDYGSPVAANCALLHPEVFQSVVLMAAPFGGRGKNPNPGMERSTDIQADLAKLDPPRTHYQWYYTTREANDNMLHCPQGLHDFLRAYIHYKSADWEGNQPFPLESWTAEEIAKMPTYYVMEADKGMAENVAPFMPSKERIKTNSWLTDEELGVYSDLYSKTGFQGGLNWYRCGKTPEYSTELSNLSDGIIRIPSLFIAGKQDWGPRQSPGSLERMQASGCSDLRGCHFIDGAGHWVQQEKPAEVTRLILEFLRSL